MPVPVTIGDRFRAAWRAFWIPTKPDPARIERVRSSLGELADHALQGVSGPDRDFIASFFWPRSATSEETHRLVSAVEKLPLPSQIALMRRAGDANNALIGHAAFQRWVMKNSEAVNTWCTTNGF